MPTPTYVALAKTVLTGSQATITFSSIPSTYTDLCILVSARSADSAPYAILELRPNGATTNRSNTNLIKEDPNAAVSIRYTNFSSIALSGATATSNTFANLEIYIPNYAGSTNKVVSWTSVTENNNANSTYINAVAGLWSNTAAISSFTLYDSYNFVSGSRFDLYGIKNS